MGMKMFRAPCEIVLALVLFSGCAALSPQANYERKVSYAIQKFEQTALNQATAQAAAAYPGLSGFRLIDEGVDGFVARARYARRAAQTVDVQYFIAQADNSGSLLIGILLDAADRGVRVRVLLDDYHGTLSDEMIELLDNHPNVEVRLFNPFSQRGSISLARTFELLFNLGHLSRRMHNKLFIVDNSIAVIGGRNLGDEYFNGESEYEFDDLDVFAVGPVVRQASESFDVYWNSDLAVPFGALVDVRLSSSEIERRRGDLVARNRRTLDSSDFMRRVRASTMDAETEGGVMPELIWAKGEVLFDPPDKILQDPLEAKSQIRQRLRELRENLQHELLVLTPYYVPGPRGVEMADGLRERGVRLGIVTNSLAATDVPAVHSGYQRYRQALLQSGVELYEVKPNEKSRSRRFASSASLAALHAKTSVFDRKVVFIGSMNIDPRSSRLNTEVGVLIESAELAARVAEMWEQLASPAGSYRLELTGGAATQSPGEISWTTVDAGVPKRTGSEPASIFRKLLVGLLALLPIEDLL